MEHGGLFARSSSRQDPNYINLGSQELINKRTHRNVPIAPGGTLSDYVPFYFTPFSIMMYNINTGYHGIKRRSNEEIAIFVSSLHSIAKLDLPFVFTDGHAYMSQAQYFNDISDLSRIDWQILQKRDFKKDPNNDPDKSFRYQAEALVHQHVPLQALRAMVCFNESVCSELEALVKVFNRSLEIRSLSRFYF